MVVLPPESGKYLGVGIQLAVSFLLCMYLGFKADKYRQSFPVLTVVGSLVGLGAGFYNLFVQLRKRNGKP